MDAVIQNHTPHDVRVFCSDEAQAVFRKVDGPPARVADAPDVVVDTVLHEGVRVPLVAVPRTPGQVVNLPDPRPGVMLIVPAPVAEAVIAHGGRTAEDLLVVRGLVKGPGRQVVGCMFLGLVGR